MEKGIISRYQLTETNEVIIDVSIRGVEDLYHNFDRSAPYQKKDLEQDFVNYLIDCVREIGAHPFVIRITLSETETDSKRTERVRQSIRNFFSYLQELEYRSLRKMLRRSAVLFAIGLCLLLIAILVNRHLAESKSVVGEVFAEGLTVAAWVSLWEALATVFLEWRPYQQDIKLYRRIMLAPVIFRSTEEPQVKEVPRTIAFSKWPRSVHTLGGTRRSKGGA